MLAELAAEVVTIERIPELAETAREALAESGYANVEVRIGDGSVGVPERAPFAGIAVAAATPAVPPRSTRSSGEGGAHRRPARHAPGTDLVSSTRTLPARSSAARSRAVSCRSSAMKGLGRTDRMGGGDDAVARLPCDDGGVLARAARSRRVLASSRARRPSKRKNWEQLVKFCLVGASGYVVNLAVFALLLDVVGLHYISAAVGSFLVAVTNNYSWNRLWTFRAQRGGVAYQGMRFFVVSTLALVANLAVLHVLVTLGLGEFVAQAIAIVLVTPVNFVGNKLWSFGPRR